MISNSQNLVIDSAQGAYPVTFHKSVSNLAYILDLQEDAYFLVDEKVWELHKEKLTFVNQTRMLLLVADEDTKNLRKVIEVVEWLNQLGATKSSLLVGIGGGVIQDVSTFVAHIYYRGIKWVFLPTTLLSQSDSCIGAKCGINVLGKKNQIGVLHSPSGVYIAEEFLGTLNKVEFESGFGEIFKLAVTGTNEFYCDLKAHLDTYALSPENSLPLIERSLVAKKTIIEIDEYEKDLRRILNYGHSFGHSLEALSNNKITHGYAIIFGMDLMNCLGMNWGITDPDFETDFRQLVASYFPDFKLEEKIDPRLLVEGLKKDKKVEHGRINFAVVRKVGQIEIVQKEIDDALLREVENYLNNVCRFYSS
jgi:3-dehydroquinate synthase